MTRKADPPHLRWGIITTGRISGWFINDILTPGPHRTATHSLAAIGASSLSKATDFWTSTVTPQHRTQHKSPPALYGSYDAVFRHPDVDCIYIGSPHSLHMAHCLSAIQARKNILCEKPLTLNQSQAQLVFAAAEQNGVFIMEGMWTRFFPCFRELHRLLHGEKMLGQIVRVWCDFGLDINVRELPQDSRYKDPALGAGSLLDLGVYSITWGLMGLDMILKGDDDVVERLDVSGVQSLVDGVDVSSTIILRDRRSGGQAICTSTTEHDSSRPDRCFARVEGRDGYVTVHGETAASPDMFVYYAKDGSEAKVYKFEKFGRGYCWEADAVAWDLREGRKQSETMGWAETLRVMGIMDGVRRKGGARFAVDEW